ncbi:MAG: DegT/DnrJ/EryC1/StrS family aminotransferase [Nannocystaceae bacterium]
MNDGDFPRVKVARPQVGEEEIRAVEAVLRSDRYISGPQVENFERKLAELVGTQHAVAVNSGTAALHAALVAVGVEPGDEVIVPALTFFSTVTPVMHQAAVPVFADIDPVTYGMCPHDLVHRITPRTKAIIPVHYFGYPVEMDGVLEVASKHGLRVIEDCAQAHGSAYRGQVVGSIGDLGAFSFFATKHVTTGEGGAVTTNNGAWAEQMRLFRSHGLKGRNDHVMLGYNYRMTEMAGALGAVQLDRLADLNRARIANTEALVRKIEGIDWLTVPSVPDHVVHTYFWCHIWVDEASLGFPTAELIKRLGQRGIETRNRYTEPLYRQPLMTSARPKILELAAGEHLPDYAHLYLPQVERIAGRVIGLPNRPDMTGAEIDRVAEVLHGIRR